MVNIVQRPPRTEGSQAASNVAGRSGISSQQNSHGVISRQAIAA